MRTRLSIAALLLPVLIVAPASAHRLDEYLQAALVSLEKDHIDVSMRLAPGAAVASSVISSIDTNGDGFLSVAEQRAYAEHVIVDLSLTADGKRLTPRLVTTEFPPIAEMRDGTGEIRIQFTAGLPQGPTNRTLLFE